MLAVEKSAVLPTCMTPTSSGLPCTIAPLPAEARVDAFVVELGDSRKITLLAAADPSTKAWDSASNDFKSPINSSTLPLP